MAEHHKIVSLISENVKRLSAVEIRPDGSWVEITGLNSAGKSSVLDSIYWALTGKDVIQKEPIRSGQEKARIQVDMGDLIITRKFTRQKEGGYTTTLTVESDSGMLAQKPQQMLDKIVGDLTADPLAFTRLKPRDQFDQLKRFVSGFDFNAWAVKRKALFDERSGANRDAKNFTAMADGTAVPEGEPPAAVDEENLVLELQKAGEHNADIERRTANRRDLSRKIDAHGLNILRLESQASSLRAQLAELEKQMAAERKLDDQERAKLAGAAPLPEPIDTAELRARIAAARDSNQRRQAHIRATQLREEYKANAGMAAAAATSITKRIEALDAEKAAAIAGAKMPVDGIGFGEDTVTINGVPFEQASMAEQLRMSVALAMAANPKVRVLLIKDGSLLDNNSRKLIADMAEASGFQVWVESVGNEDKPGVIIIEDGAVRAKHKEAAE